MQEFDTVDAKLRFNALLERHDALVAHMNTIIAAPTERTAWADGVVAQALGVEIPAEITPDLAEAMDAKARAYLAPINAQTVELCDKLAVHAIFAKKELDVFQAYLGVFINSGEEYSDEMAQHGLVLQSKETHARQLRDSIKDPILADPEGFGLAARELPFRLYKVGTEARSQIDAAPTYGDISRMAIEAEIEAALLELDIRLSQAEFGFCAAYLAAHSTPELVDALNNTVAVTSGLATSWSQNVQFANEIFMRIDGLMSAHSELLEHGPGVDIGPLASSGDAPGLKP